MKPYLISTVDMRIILLAKSMDDLELDSVKYGYLNKTNKSELLYVFQGPALKLYIQGLLHS